uniref:Transposon Ty3-I Gag-Pol polyprotein n=1 Tax=Lygus hesperus TaxID=30085 RepID=A0A146L9X3_LYGHE
MPYHMLVSEYIEGLPNHETNLGLGEELLPQQLNDVKQFIAEFADIFAKDATDLGQIEGCSHDIDVGTNHPIRQAPRCIPPARRGEVDKLEAEMEQHGIIEPTKSLWASPIVLVKKKDGSTRFYIDYCQLNDITKKDSHPLPKVDELI